MKNMCLGYKPNLFSIQKTKNKPHTMAILNNQLNVTVTSTRTFNDSKFVFKLPNTGAFVTNVMCTLSNVTILLHY